MLKKEIEYYVNLFFRKELDMELTLYNVLFLPIIFFVISSLIAYSVSGIFISFFPSLTNRAQRIVFMHNIYVTSFAYGLIQTIAIYYSKFLILSNILLIGSLVAFLLSFKSPLFRRRSYLIPTIWCGICIIIAIILPF
jgi:hypothetical protein